ALAGALAAPPDLPRRLAGPARQGGRAGHRLRRRHLRVRLRPARSRRRADRARARAQLEPGRLPAPIARLRPPALPPEDPLQARGLVVRLAFDSLLGDADRDV